MEEKTCFIFPIRLPLHGSQEWERGRAKLVPFTVEEFHDLVRMLEESPEWRSELRRLVLTDELLALPAPLAELRVHTEQRFQELAVAQRRTEEQIVAVSAQLAGLIQVVQTFATDLGELKGRRSG
jgi:hypothetical protein